MFLCWTLVEQSGTRYKHIWHCTHRIGILKRTHERREIDKLKDALLPSKETRVYECKCNPAMVCLTLQYASHESSYECIWKKGMKKKWIRRPKNILYMSLSRGLLFYYFWVFVNQLHLGTFLFFYFFNIRYSGFMENVNIISLCT